MNWIERMYEIKGKDLYSQNGEGVLLEYVFKNIRPDLKASQCQIIDIGGGDGEYLSNSAHLKYIGWNQIIRDKENGHFITVENVMHQLFGLHCDILSIDIDGNDYWILDEVLPKGNFIHVVIAEFNPAFTDSRTIKYNPDHEWDGSDYYGFSFEAGKKLAEKHGYEIIFNVANMNLIMVRKDLITGLYVPPVTYEQVKFFKESNRTDWEWI